MVVKKKKKEKTSTVVEGWMQSPYKGQRTINIVHVFSALIILIYKSFFLSYVPNFTEVLHISVHQWNSESITVCKIPLPSRALRWWSPLRPPWQSRSPQPAVGGPPPAKSQRRQDRRCFRQNGWASKDPGTLLRSKPATGDETQKSAKEGRD